MYRLFTEQLFRGRRISPEFIQARSKYQDTLEKAVRYYSTNNVWINNDHPLVRMVNGFDIDTKQSDGAVYRRYTSRADEISAGLGITTYRNIGEMVDDVFYGNNCILIATEFEDFSALDNDWTRWAPVRPLTFQFTSLKPVLPNLIKDTGKTDYSVVGIDIALLAVQYKNWLKEEQRKPEAERYGTTVFISQFVLPQMLPYQADIVMRNRYLSLALGNKMYDTLPDTPFLTLLYEAEFDKGMMDLIKELRRGTPTFDEITEALPMITADVYADAVPESVRVLSIYSYWATFLIYLDWAFVILRSVDDINMDEGQINNSIRSVKRFLNAAAPFKRYNAIVSTRIKSKWDYVVSRTK